VSIGSNGYVCLGDNSECVGRTRPSGHDIVIGLNIDLDPRRKRSGQIYYKKLDSNSSDFQSNKIHLNLFNPRFKPQQIFMITYDNVLPYYRSSASLTSFQIYLSTDSDKSFVTFKFKSCPTDLDFYAPSGLNYKRIDGNLKEVKIIDSQQCIGSNVGQTGVWVSVTSKGKVKELFFYSVFSKNRAQYNKFTNNKFTDNKSTIISLQYNKFTHKKVYNKLTGNKFTFCVY
jgi:hypothetical protein